MGNILENQQKKGRKVIPFKRFALARAIKGAQDAGLSPKEVRISPDGCIVLNFEGISSNNTKNVYDNWMNDIGKISA